MLHEPSGSGCRAAPWSRFPVPGPGALQDLQGPSYLYAILTDPRITGEPPEGLPTAPVALGKHARRV